MPELPREPLHVPLAGSLDVLYRNFERVEIERGDGIEADIEDYQSPFKEGIDGVGWVEKVR